LGLLLVLVAGCSNRAERLYQRAEALLATGQAHMAAGEYYKLVVEEPRSALADDALYKLAFLYREELDSLPRALQTYQYLADQYPSSPYADDALLWIVTIQGQRLKDPLAVRRALLELGERFPSETALLAQAHLQLVKTLLATGRAAEAEREAQTLIDRYPAQERTVAAALLVRARVAGEGEAGRDSALKLYEQIIGQYPQTPSAAEAKRAIGWAYYGERSRQVEETQKALQRAARVISGVPPPAATQQHRLRALVGLRSLLQHRGVEADLTDLAVVSGAAFETYFSPTDPQATARLLTNNVLTAAAESYGFAVNLWSTPSAEASFASLGQAVSAGRPVMVPQAGGQWLIVMGYRPAADQVHVLAPGRSGPQILSKAQFISRWAREKAAGDPCIAGPYFQFSLGERTTVPTPLSLVHLAARRGSEALSRREARGVAAGLQAHTALLSHLTQLGESGSSEALSRSRRWAENSLPALLADRRMVAGYFSRRGGVLPADQQSSAREAAAAAEEIARGGAELRRLLLALTQQTQGAEAPPDATWPEALDLTRSLQAAEEQLQHALNQIAR
jgi:TolA-binding protein